MAIGVCVGLLAAFACDLRLTIVTVLLFPGLLAGWTAAGIAGPTAGVLACALANGIAYALPLYVWDRLANSVSHALPWLLRRIGERPRSGA